jgi:hypothetical protein
MDLKALFGDKDSLTLDELVKATASMKLVDLNEGLYVGKDKFEASEAKAKKAKDAADAATAELADVKKAAEGDGGTEAQIKALNERLETESKARQDAESRATRKEREATVSKFVASPKLQRTLLDDAIALMDDGTDFDAAVAKAIAADPDYAPKVEDDEASKPVRLGMGKAPTGKPADPDVALEAFKKGLNGEAEAAK